jgi:hypothetical protein
MIFKVLEMKNAASISRKTPATPTLASRLHCQISRIAISNKAEVISIVADTAMPYAAARLSDLPNPMVSAIVTTISIQFTGPT